MNRTSKPLIAAVALSSAAFSMAWGYPEGAPWGTASPAFPESCSNCHYDYEPVNNSPALQIEGLPRSVLPGHEYHLVVRLSGVDATVSGFQLLALAEEQSAGTFRADDDNIEAVGSATRSTWPEDAQHGAAWHVVWRAPTTERLPVVLYLAANAANDDQSPLGDTIHYRTFVVHVAGSEPH